MSGVTQNRVDILVSRHPPPFELVEMLQDQSISIIFNISETNFQILANYIQVRPVESFGELEQARPQKYLGAVEFYLNYRHNFNTNKSVLFANFENIVF